MHADTTAGMPTIYVKASELLELDGQESFNKLLASFSTHQQARNVQRDPFGQSCAVAPIVRMDKLMSEVVEKAARRVARDMIKEQCAYEINLLVAAEYYKNGDWEKSVDYGEHLIDQMLDEAMKAVLGGKQE